MYTVESLEHTEKSGKILGHVIMNDLLNINLCMNKRNYIIGAISIFVLIVIGVFMWSSNDQSESTDITVEHRGLDGDPTDIMLDFYHSWLTKRTSTSTTDTVENPLDSMALSYSLQEKLASFDFSASEPGLDPVFCQNSIPDKFRSRSMSKQDEMVQILVISSNEQAQEYGQAAVTLEKHNDLWEIARIDCGNLEQAPDTGEFNFNQEGRLLRDSLPDSFSRDSWYIVYSQNDIPGHTVPLLLDDKSMCTTQEGNVISCADFAFYEAVHVYVQGQMTEAGVDVHQVKILP